MVPYTLSAAFLLASIGFGMAQSKPSDDLAPRAMVLYSGELRPFCSHPAVVQNQIAFFDKLFGSRTGGKRNYAVIALVHGSGAQLQGCHPLAVLSPERIEVTNQSDMVDAEVVYCAQSTCPQLRYNWWLQTQASHQFRVSYVAQKHILHRVHELMQSSPHASTAEFFVRMRFDLVFENQHAVPAGGFIAERAPSVDEILGAAIGRSIVTPAEGNWGSINDQFAIGPMALARAYFGQYQDMLSGNMPCACCEDQEHFLFCSLCAAGVSFVEFPLASFLVRTDGRKQMTKEGDAGLFKRWGDRIRSYIPYPIDVHGAALLARNRTAVQRGQWLASAPPDAVRSCDLIVPHHVANFTVLRRRYRKLAAPCWNNSWRARDGHYDACITQCERAAPKCGGVITDGYVCYMQSYCEGVVDDSRCVFHTGRYCSFRRSRSAPQRSKLGKP